MKSRIILIFLFVISLTGCKNNRVALIGDAYILNNLIDEKNDSNFVVSKMTSKNFYYYLDNDAISLENKKNISSVLKKRSKVILSFGIYDLIPLFDFSNKEIIYQKEQVENKIELIDYYVYSSFQLLDDILDSKTKVYVIKQYNPLMYNFDNIQDFISYIEKVNDILLSNSSKHSFSFVEIENYEKYLLDDFILDYSINGEINKNMQ